MRALFIAVTLGLMGCVSHTVYQPIDHPIEKVSCSCCAPLISSIQRIKDGVVIKNKVYKAYSFEDKASHLYLTMEIALAPGMKAKLHDTRMSVSWTGQAEPTHFELSEFSSGAEGFGVPRLTYSADQVLVGTNRLGELSPPYGPTERFNAYIALSSMQPPEITVIPPKVLVGDQVFVPLPVKFKLREVSVPCVQ